MHSEWNRKVIKCCSRGVSFCFKLSPRLPAAFAVLGKLLTAYRIIQKKCLGHSVYTLVTLAACWNIKSSVHVAYFYVIFPPGEFSGTERGKNCTSKDRIGSTRVTSCLHISAVTWCEQAPGPDGERTSRLGRAALVRWDLVASLRF